MSYGPQAVHEIIQEEFGGYPVSVDRLRNARPLTNLELSEGGDTVMLAELLLRVDADRFESFEELEAELQPAIKQEMRSRENGIIGRLKRLFT